VLSVRGQGLIRCRAARPSGTGTRSLPKRSRLSARRSTAASCTSRSSVIPRYVLAVLVALRILSARQGEIYVQFESIDAAKLAINGLNGRWFGGKQISATFIPDAIMQAHK
jgi:hypothetical protein